MNFYKVGIDPPEQSHTSYEASALPPSHHGWIVEATYCDITLGQGKSDNYWPVLNKSDSINRDYNKQLLQL